MSILNKINLTPGDLYRIQNKRKQTYKKIGFILVEIYNKNKSFGNYNNIRLSTIKKQYKIDERTLKRYLDGYIHKIGYNTVLTLNEYDLMIIEQTIATINKFNFIDKRSQKISKYIAYNLVNK